MPQENKDGAAAVDPKDLNGAGDGTGANGAGDGSGDGKGKDGNGDDKDDEVEVTIKKGELKKLQKANEDNDNYQKALGIGKYKKAKEDRTVDKPTPSSDNDSKFVTKDELQKANQKTAIKIATTVAKDDDAETAKIKKDLDEHWDDIKAFYTGRRGKETPEDVVEDLYDAHAVWARNSKGKGQDDKNARAHLSTDRGTGGRSPSNDSTKRTRVLPKSAPPSEWYPKKSS